MNTIINLVSRYKNVILLPHKNADLDAVASCYILSNILNIPVGLLNQPVENASNFIKLFHMDVALITNPAEYDLIIFVDSCESVQFNRIKPKNAIIIDHHLCQITHPIENVLAKHIVSKDKYISCSCMIYELFLKSKINVTPKIASAIIAGFIGDGGWLMATPHVRNLIENLLEISYYDLYELNKLIEHNKIKIKTKIAHITKSLHSIVYEQINNIDLAFVETKHRSDFFFIYDNLLSKLDISIIVSKIVENNQNIIRFEKIDHLAKEQIDIVLLFKNLEKEVENLYFKHEFSYFASLESWEEIQTKIKKLIS
jgi:nanoRNase/pAp phosphatase (c-di-AMP/oligoRNAs hydrolase)